MVYALWILTLALVAVVFTKLKRTRRCTDWRVRWSLAFLSPTAVNVALTYSLYPQWFDLALAAFVVCVLWVQFATLKSSYQGSHA